MYPDISKTRVFSNLVVLFSDKEKHPILRINEVFHFYLNTTFEELIKVTCKACSLDLLCIDCSKPQWLIEYITTYSSFDIEFFLREIFEEAYQLHCDDGHTKWKLHLLDNSLVCNRYIIEINYNNWVNKKINNCLIPNSNIGKHYWEELRCKIRNNVNNIDYDDNVQYNVHKKLSFRDNDEEEWRIFLENHCDKVKSTTIVLRRFETDKVILEKTVAYCLILYDQIITYSPFFEWRSCRCTKRTIGDTQLCTPCLSLRMGCWGRLRKILRTVEHERYNLQKTVVTSLGMTSST
ncbi:hypothetical protein AGLY_002204 [Aphis glycines]|uniref:Uncharacterized protein n=1 Tax=Aphis glycines TaxID=307491 RepID=A0A6G0U2U8_APHGL|nr:hypothetical protein AGLY_002204 [Aphis glycines]